MLLAAHGTRSQTMSYWTKHQQMIELSPSLGSSDLIVDALAPAYPAIACKIARAVIRVRLPDASTMRKRSQLSGLLERAKTLAATSELQPDHSAFLIELRQRHPRKMDRILQRKPAAS